MTDLTLNKTQSVKLSVQQRIATVFVTAFLGLFVVYGVGFAAPAEVHNAAHDGRHAHAFPCH